MKNKLTGLLLIASSMALVSCGSKGIDMNNWRFSPKSEEKIAIGILQPLEHSALGAARDGFIAGLAEGGYSEKLGNITINYQNANGVEADQTTLAKSLVGGCDLTLGIGTGASTALQAASINSGNTNPILFTAVTDPVDAGLVDTNENPGGYITGTSDANPVEAQIALIKECIPDITKIGILYTQSETNSEVQARQAKAAAEKQNIEVVTKTCTDSSDLSSVANELIGNNGIQALYIPTDNNVAANFGPVKAALETYHVLCVAGEENMMKKGAHVTLSVDYEELGKKTAEMALKIIKREAKPNELPVKTMSIAECGYVMCQDNITNAGLTIPEEVANKCTNVQPE